MSHTIYRHATADAFLRRAEAWLVLNEAEHNLILGLADRLRQSAEGNRDRTRTECLGFWATLPTSSVTD